MPDTFLNWTSRAAIAGRVAECRRPQNWNGFTLPGEPFGRAEVRAEAAKWFWQI